jgi:hypothetical protein
MRFKNALAYFIVVFLISCTSVAVPKATRIFSPTSISTSRSLLTPISTNTFTPKQIFSLFNELHPTPTFFPIPSIRPYNDQISGKYEYQCGDYCGCRLNVVLEPPQPNPYRDMDFMIYCVSGAPTYDSGLGMGKIRISNNIAVYTNRLLQSDDLLCSIVFQFEKDRVIVTQIGSGSECGFGHRVRADGVYKLVDSKPPQMDCVFLYNEDVCLTATPTP